MWIELNKKKLKKAGTGVLAIALAFGVAAGYRLIQAELQEKKDENPTEETAATETGSSAADWGLSFQKEGEAPVGNATSGELKKYQAYYCANPEEKFLYLTFDAGYENGYTTEILDVLKKEKVPAAFFVVGTYIKANPELIKRMEKEGHIVCNHTMNHPDMSAISDQEAFEKELSEAEAEYKEVTGKEMKKFYRPPQGKFSFENLELAKDLDYTTVFWSLAYVDWYVDKQPTREEAFEKLLPRTHNGAIILLHSTSKTNVEILAELIERWKEAGYQFKSLEELS